MPLVVKCVDPSSLLAKPEIIQTATKENIFQSINVTNTIGSLTQLGIISEYATTLFTELLSSLESLNSRITIVSSRATNLVSKLPDVQKVLKSKEFSPETGANAHRALDQVITRSILIKDTIPLPIKQRYESDKLLRPSPVQEMDALISAEDLLKHGGTCANHYSYPQFFIEEWMRVQQEEQNLLQEQKEARKRERRERKQQKIIDRRASMKPMKKKTINWKDRYNTEAFSGSAGSVAHISPTSTTTSSKPPIPTMSAEEIERLRQERIIKDKEKQNRNSFLGGIPPQMTINVNAAPADAVQMLASSPTKQKKLEDDLKKLANNLESITIVPPPPSPSARNPPPPPQPPTRGPSFSVRVPSTTSSSASSNADASSLPSAAPSATSTYQINTALSEHDYNETPPPYSSTGAVQFSPFSTPPANASTSGNSSLSAPPNYREPPAPVSIPPVTLPPRPNFLKDISQRRELRAVSTEEQPVKPRPGGPGPGSFLSEIKKGATLKKVTAVTSPVAARASSVTGSMGAFGGQAVANILERRKHLESDDEDESDDEEDDDDWDD